MIQKSNFNNDIAVCIVFFEKVDQTIECIKSVLRTSKKYSPNIYVFNNNSSPETTKILKDHCAAFSNIKIKIFDSDKNLGPSGGRNALVEKSTERWLLFLDNDIVVKTNSWIDKFQRVIENKPDFEVFIPLLFNKHEYFFCRYRNFAIENKKIVEVESTGRVINNFPGGASLVDRRLFERLGGYDPQMFPGYEDLEFSIRALKSQKPIRAYLLKNILLVHDHRKPKTDKDAQATKIRYHQKLNEECCDRLCKKHDIEFDADHHEWVRKQKQQILEGRSFSKALTGYIRKAIKK